MYELLRILFVIVTFFLTVECKELSCNPADAIPKYVGRDMTCDDCKCKKHGKVLICLIGSCIRPDGSQVEDEWGEAKFPVVKRCNFGMHVFDKCNICLCDQKQKPSYCTKMGCTKISLNELMQKYPKYPLIKRRLKALPL
ncbi:uncharacterized protein LOC108738535 [Agrilus planipennis]|uniref:Uncharacterized protein LOC108738535 n=1 Tax=Agrilus planipennis TaxID=224129 RepID=A0A1W4WUD8_AGRPL|nr:uncharacterized protein LOC108738535 [Agrilus planipennis]